MTWRLAPILIGVVLVLPLAASCGERFADTDYPARGPSPGRRSRWPLSTGSGPTVMRAMVSTVSHTATVRWRE